MFEDKAGSELVNFQAQKDHKLLVKNDRAKLVQHDQSRPHRQQRQALGRRQPRRGRRQQQDDEGRRRPHGRRSARTTPRRWATNRSLTVGVDETIASARTRPRRSGRTTPRPWRCCRRSRSARRAVDTVGAAETRTVGAAQVNTIGAVAPGHGRRLARATTSAASDSWTVQARARRSTIGGDRAQIGTDAAPRATRRRDRGRRRAGAARSPRAACVEHRRGRRHDQGRQEPADRGGRHSIVLKCGSAAIVDEEGRHDHHRGQGHHASTARARSTSRRRATSS